MFYRTLSVAWVLALLLAATVHAIPPLTEDQQAQLETASDFDNAFESGAVYPLMQNAAAWNAGDEAGAQIPDYDAILANPAAYRGQLFLLEGRMAGPVEEVRVTRPGVWGETVEHWFLKISDDKEDEALVVRLVDPPDEKPRVGSALRIPARFYKAWQIEDMQGKPATFLTFVGRTARIDERAAPASTGPGAGSLGTLMVLGVILLAAGFYYVRRMTPKGELRSKTLARRHREEADQYASELEAEAEAGVLDEPLPEDPTAALEELQRRRDAQGTKE